MNEGLKQSKSSNGQKRCSNREKNRNCPIMAQLQNDGVANPIRIQMLPRQQHGIQSSPKQPEPIQTKRRIRLCVSVSVCVCVCVSVLQSRNVVGNVIGNAVGNVIGNAVGNVIGNVIAAVGDSMDLFELEEKMRRDLMESAGGMMNNSPVSTTSNRVCAQSIGIYSNTRQLESKEIKEGEEEGGGGGGGGERRRRGAKKHVACWMEIPGALSITSIPPFPTIRRSSCSLFLLCPMALTISSIFSLSLFLSFSLNAGCFFFKGQRRQVSSGLSPEESLTAFLFLLSLSLSIFFSFSVCPLFLFHSSLFLSPLGFPSFFSFFCLLFSFL